MKISAEQLLHKKVAMGGRVSTVTFQVTDSCNYSCSHCFQEHVANNELTTSEVKDTLEQLAEFGVLFLTMMGGEIFMRRDADEILQFAHDLGFSITLKTTGHHVHARRADFLATIRPLTVDVSVYGSKPEVHEHITQHPGSWKRSIDAIERLVARRIPVVLRTPVTESNMDDVKRVRDLAKALGTDISFDPKIISKLDGDLDPLNHRMGKDSLGRFYRDTMADDVAAFWGQDRGDKADLNSPTCRAGQDIAFINPRGEVWPCGLLPIPLGDLRKTRFSDIWNTSPKLAGLKAVRWATIPECNVCELRTYCNRCHGSALAEDGNMLGPSLEACRHAVAVRDSLKDNGHLPPSHNALPPTWDRVNEDGAHKLESKRRSPSLRIIS